MGRNDRSGWGGQIVALLLAFAIGGCATTAPQSGPANPELQAQRLAQAENAYQAGRYSVAAGMLLPLAERGNAQAIYTLGYMNFYGHGLRQDRPRAIALIKQAAVLGSKQALDALAQLAELAVRSDPELELPASQ